MLRIGVTGHRKLADVATVEASIEIALAAIAARFPAKPLRVLSALAEGSDRIVARHVLARPGARLIAVLPLPRSDYMTDFESQRSREEFLDLLGEAESEIELPPRGSRIEAYEQVGRYVAEHSDVLVAVWDGLPASGRGGTAEIVEWARGLGKPICHVWAGNSRKDPAKPTDIGEKHGMVEYINFGV
jgi:hypothetical protein